jgi:hypothetical protein
LHTGGQALTALHIWYLFGPFYRLFFSSILSVLRDRIYTHITNIISTLENYEDKYIGYKYI